MTKNKIRLIIFFVLFSFSFSEIELKIAVSNFVYNNYYSWLKENNYKEIDSFNSKYSNRQTVELIILMKALKKANPNYSFKFLKFPNYARAMYEVKAGNADLMSETIWDEEINNDFYATEEIIDKNVFEKGIYICSKNKENIKIKNLEDLKKYNCIIMKDSSMDLKIIQELSLKNTYNISKKENLFYMIKNQRGDYTFLEFTNNKDMENLYLNMSLIPIEGIKIKIKNSKHFVVSKNIKNSKKVFNDLEKGIEILKSEGIIKKAYEKSGFLNKTVDNWKILN